MMMKQIEAFVAVVKHRSFSRAAEDLFLSQPTISAHISSLEDELGVNLIVRTTKTVYPSEAGKIFYEYAISTLGAREQIKASLKNYSYKMCGTSYIPAHSIPAQYVLPLLLQDFVKTYSDIKISISECSDAQVADSIVGTQAQIGVTSSVVNNSHCTMQKIFRDHFVVIAPNLPRYCQLGVIDRGKICSLPFIGWKSDGGLSCFNQNFFQRSTIDQKLCNIVFEADSHEGVLQAVRNGIGISVSTRLCAESLLSTEEIVRLDCDFEMPQQDYYVVYHRTRPLNPISTAIKNALLGWGKM